MGYEEENSRFLCAIKNEFEQFDFVKND